MSEIDAPRVPGFSTGVVALALAAAPALWIGAYLILTGIPGVQDTTSVMLLAEPFVLPIAAALGIIIALFALWRDTRAGRTLAVIALALVLVEAAVIVGLILL